MKNCHFCKSFETNTSDTEPEYRCSACANNHKMLKVCTYYMDEYNIFALSFMFDIDGREYAVESYFERTKDDKLANNSVIYCHDNGERILIPGHPFTIENVKNKTKTYLIFS